MKHAGALLILVLFGAAAAGTWQAGFPGGAAFLAVLGAVALLLLSVAEHDGPA